MNDHSMRALSPLLYYLASPYSHDDRLVREWRYQQAKKAIAFLLSEGLFAISPIVHTHVLATESDLPTNHLFWANYDRALLERCDGLIVLAIEGWSLSKGVRLELGLSRRLCKDIFWLESTAEGHLALKEAAPSC